MKEDELKYILNLLEDISDEIYEEILHFYYDKVDSKPCEKLSEGAWEVLKTNLLKNPVTTSTIFTFIAENSLDGSDELEKIQNIYLEILKSELSGTGNIDKFLTLLSLFKFEDKFVSDLIHHVLQLVSDNIYRQHRKQILMSLMLQGKPELLKIASEQMQQNEPHKEFKLTPEYMLELCYQDRTHWLLKAAQVYKHQLQDMNKVTFKINNFTKQILVMVLIDLTNSQETYDLSSLVHQLTNTFSILDTYSSLDEHLQFYMTEVKRELTIIKFCLENNCKILTTSIFSQVLGQSALAVISQVCRLSKVDRYKISRLLNMNNDVINELNIIKKTTSNSVKQSNLNWDIVTYNSYCAITKVIDTILSSSKRMDESNEISTSLDEIKRLVISIQPIELSIEVIENLFSCLFIRYEYFSCPEHPKDYPCGTHSDCSYFYSKKQVKNNLLSSTAGFMCSPLTTQLILNTLKLCLENLENSVKGEGVDQSTVSRLKRLVKIVNHSLWKLQLVSTLSPDASPVQPKLCLDYVEVNESSEDEDRDIDLKVYKKKPRSRRRHTYSKKDIEQAMFTSTISANDEVYSNKGSSIDFISTMLAKPNSLVALALYHNDFSKANQIIEMFDLADAEIATEVTFTEQLRHLVAKIKNIIYYRDDTRYATKELSALSVVSTEVMGLVEGFLASNRAPNSFDIIELAARHPHLQLYSHQNAPFINAVDILLSSGLNREITYGLINVVERKLAEVRCCTDVDSVKKTNYIRFMEDIASVTFEIFGNTEKCFNFPDDVCSLIVDSRVPIKHKEFCKLNQLSKELRQSCEDLVNIVNPVEAPELNQSLLQKYHQIYMNVVAASDKDMCNIADVLQYGNKKTRVHYLRMCYMYCKAVSQLENDEKTDSPTEKTPEASYFSVLEKPLHQIFGNMINSREIPISQLEPICKKLNINLIPKLILNFCPPVALAGQHKEASEATFNNLLQCVYEFKNWEENLFVEPTTNFNPLPGAPDPQCLTYIILNNWVLAHIIKKIHTSPNENALQQSMDARTKFLNNYMELERFNRTKTLFDDNKYLASLHTMLDLNKLFEYMPQLVASGKLLKCLNIIEALSERQTLNSPNLINLRDLLLFKIAINSNIGENWKYAQYLKCSELKIDLIMNNLCSWTATGAMEALDYLRFLLDPGYMEEGLYKQCSDWMVKIPLFDQIATLMEVKPWYTIHEKSLENPESIIDFLIDSQQFKLCLEWADVHDVSDHMKHLIIKNLLRQSFEYTSSATPSLIQQLLSRLPKAQSMELIQEEMSKVKNVEILQVCVKFISDNSTDWKSFENIKIGLQIMLEINENLRSLFWELIDRPLLMLEQFLMNAKLDMLCNIINKISPNLKKDPSGDNLYYNIKLIDSLVISRNAVDALLRFYAEKALDMKNPHNAFSQPPKPSDDVLLQSIDSINIEAANRPFVMPQQVPSKDQWTEDMSTDRCMVCKTSIFSMIIRRHHCRRCGRLVCHACSRHRMQVPTYPTGVKLRVCKDCYTQTINKKSGTDEENAFPSSNSDSAGSGVTCMDWCLSTNPNKNEAVREEFSFEFTPNVTLCLSIMKMHSLNLDYPRFLLDRSDETAREVWCGGDARLLIRARRSLLLAAAEIYSRASLHCAGGSSRVAETGAGHAMRCLAHADAMATLVKHQAHHLIPPQGAHPSQIVRSLLEAEKWELALEIATKSSLPRNSVLAAWGKACLKAGCFKQAREKFAHCFKNSLNLVYNDIPEDCEYGKEASESPFVNRRLQSLRQNDRTSSVSSVQSDGRPRSNPPLLNEIVSILEDMNYPVNQQLLNKAENIKNTHEKLSTLSTKKRIPITEPALNIMHTLASVKKIKQGDYSDFQTGNVQPRRSLAQGLLRRNNNHVEHKPDYNKKLDPFFYKECVFYLTNYGSHAANIAFFMKHSNLTEVIKYCYDNMVDRDSFTECVYMDCLKKDRVNDLLKAMTEMDNSLEMWAEYIMHVCRTLEMSKRLEALYVVQCGSGQHGRASATCALLYSRPVPRQTRPFSALLARQHYLNSALHHLSQCVPVTNRISDPKSFQFHLDKATIDNLMTTISRQIELAKYLANCEANNRLTEKLVLEVIPIQNVRKDVESKNFRPLTLFGSNTDKIRLVAVVLACGQTVQEGFDLAFKIITEHKLDSMNIYTHVAKYLVKTDRFIEVKALAKCIRESRETAANMMSDQVLEAGVSAVVRGCEARGQLHDEQAELLIADICSLNIKISCYLTCRNVSNAYILAARHDRSNELRRILQEAERLGNDQVRNACLKRLTSKNIL